MQLRRLKMSLATAQTGIAGSPCARALAQGAVCEAANQRAIELMKARGLEAATLVLDVQTGALVAFAATPGSTGGADGAGELKVTTPVLPLSLTKLFLAASWWDHGLPDRGFDCIRTSAPEKIERMATPEMIVIGCDLPAKQVALALQKKIGADAVLADLERYGFGVRSKSPHGDGFCAMSCSVDQRNRLPRSAARRALVLGRRRLGRDRMAGLRDWFSIRKAGRDLRSRHSLGMVGEAVKTLPLFPPSSRAT